MYEGPTSAYQVSTCYCGYKHSPRVETEHHRICRENLDLFIGMCKNYRSLEENDPLTLERNFAREHEALELRDFLELMSTTSPDTDTDTDHSQSDIEEQFTNPDDYLDPNNFAEELGYMSISSDNNMTTNFYPDESYHLLVRDHPDTDYNTSGNTSECDPYDTESEPDPNDYANFMARGRILTDHD